MKTHNSVRGIIATVAFLVLSIASWSDTHVRSAPIGTDHFPSEGLTRLSTTPAACDGGAGFEKVVVIYAWTTTDRLSSEIGTLRAEAAKFDDAFERESGRRWSQKVDWLRDGSGAVAVCSVKVQDTSGDGRLQSGEMRATFGPAGLDMPNRKYVVYVDTTLPVCSTTEGAGCASAHHGYARYPLNKDVALHELVHTLGCCPGGPDSHVTETYDLMGEYGGGGGSGPRNCERRPYSDTNRFPKVIDCMKNQYYSATAAVGSNPDFLGTYGNLATSLYLTQLAPEVQGHNSAMPMSCVGYEGVQFGEEYSETLTISEAYYFNALEGNDHITQGLRICGGDGNDIMESKAGADVVSGGAGNDRLYGGADNDILYDGWGADTIDGGFGTDTLYRCDDGITGETITNVENQFGPSAAYCHHNYE